MAVEDDALSTEDEDRAADVLDGYKSRAAARGHRGNSLSVRAQRLCWTSTVSMKCGDLICIERYF